MSDIFRIAYRRSSMVALMCIVGSANLSAVEIAAAEPQSGVVVSARLLGAPSGIDAHCRVGDLLAVLPPVIEGESRFVMEAIQVRRSLTDVVVPAPTSPSTIPRAPRPPTESAPRSNIDYDGTVSLISKLNGRITPSVAVRVSAYAQELLKPAVVGQCAIVTFADKPHLIRDTWTLLWRSPTLDGDRLIVPAAVDAFYFDPSLQDGSTIIVPSTGFTVWIPFRAIDPQRDWAVGRLTALFADLIRGATGLSEFSWATVESTNVGVTYQNYWLLPKQGKPTGRLLAKGEITIEARSHTLTLWCAGSCIVDVSPSN